MENYETTAAALLQRGDQRRLREARDRHLADRGLRRFLVAITDPHHGHLQSWRQAFANNR